MVDNEITPEKSGSSLMRNHKYFRNIYYLSVVFGIFPFSLQRSRGFSSYFLCIMSITVTIYVAYCEINMHYKYFSDLPKDRNKITSIDVVLQTCLLTTYSFLYLLSTATSIWRVRSVRQIVKILEEVDLLLNCRPRKEYKFQDILCFVLNCLIFSWLIYAEQCISFGLPYAAVTFNTYLTTSQFSVLISLISNRLQEACKSLNDIKKNTKPSHHQRMVVILSDVHDKLCDASEFLQSFSLVITAIIIVSFIGLTAIAFFMYNHQNLSKLLDMHYILSRNPKNFPPTDKILWFMYHLAIVWRIAASSSELTEKTKEFNGLLYQLMVNDKSSELMRNEKLLLHLSMRREVVLTACGLFDLDFTLVHSMLAATATYLVMLIQFGQQE